MEYWPVNVLPEIPDKVIFQGLEFNDYQDESGKIYRRFHDAVHDNWPYAVMTQDLENHRVRVEYLPEAERFFSETGNSLFHTNWEKIFAMENRLILHASCVDTVFGGVLFSGPSGIGKSTQSDLWCEHQNGELINGDRPVLWKKDGQWRAYGSPYAGSSRCYVNKSCPIRAIIMLKQAPRCSIRRLKAGEAFRKVFSGVTVNSWDVVFLNQVCDLVTDLVTSIPVYELSCTPDVAAVDILKAELERGETER